MKLIIAIIHDEYSVSVIKSLTDHKYRTTKLTSTGGFLKAGNTTLLIGVEAEQTDRVVRLIESACNHKEKDTEKDGVTVGKASIFILDMDQFIKI